MELSESQKLVEERMQRFAQQRREDEVFFFNIHMAEIEEYKLQLAKANQQLEEAKQEAKQQVDEVIQQAKQQLGEATQRADEAEAQIEELKAQLSKFSNDYS